MSNEIFLLIKNGSIKKIKSSLKKINNLNITSTEYVKNKLFFSSFLTSSLFCSSFWYSCCSTSCSFSSNYYFYSEW